MKILLTTNAVIMIHGENNSHDDVVSCYQYLKSGSVYEMDGVDGWDRTFIKMNLTFYTL